MHQSRQRRFQLELAKITSVGTLMGLGAILNEKMDIRMFFYFILFIALAFDVFILSQSFLLKRMATFVSYYKHNEKLNDEERTWENFVKLNADKYGKVAGGITSITISLASVFILLSGENYWPEWLTTPINLLWALVLCCSFSYIKWEENRMSKSAWAFPENNL